MILQPGDPRRSERTAATAIGVNQVSPAAIVILKGGPPFTGPGFLHFDFIARHCRRFAMAHALHTRLADEIFVYILESLTSILAGTCLPTTKARNCLQGFSTRW